MTWRMKTRESHVGRVIEECQILQSREAIELRAIAICFLMSCSLNPVLCISTHNIHERLDEFHVVSSDGHKGACG